MRTIAMVEIDQPGLSLGPYPAVLDTEHPELSPRFNRHTIERICRDAQAPLGQLADVPGEGEYARLVDEGELVWVEFYRMSAGPLGEQCDPVGTAMPAPDGRFPIGERWPWEVVTGSRGQVWQCCVSTIGPVCGHQVGL